MNHISDEGLVSRKCKEFLQFNNKKVNNLKIGKESKPIFLQRKQNNQ